MMKSKLVGVVAALTSAVALAACTTTAPANTRSLAAADSDYTSVSDKAPKVTPRIEDFKIGLIVTSDECFGSAGALTVVEPELAYMGPEFEGTYRLIYKIAVSGGGSTITETIEVSGDGTYSAPEQMVDSPTCNATLTPTIERIL